MAKLMFDKFEKYWSEFSLVLAIAVILDPRYKLQFVDWAYKKLYGDNSKEFEKVKNTLYYLYDEYASKPSCSSSATSTVNKVNKSAQYESIAWLEFDSFDLEYGVATKKSQLELYFEKPKVDRSMDLNVLHFWKQSAFRYPELAAMAQDILSIPITTVASESTFSVRGKVLDQYRSSLKPDIVEAIVCTKDWLFGDIDKNFDDSINNAINLDLSKEDSTSTSMKCSSNALASAQVQDSAELL
ncbi:hypothetical protein PTKIN_Ptkin15bG0144500 [Pterospermum kingtungense]